MEDLPKILLQFLDDVTVEVEHFFHDFETAIETFSDDIINAFEDFSDHFIEDLENLTHQLENNIFINFDEYYRDFFEDDDLDIYVNNSPEENVVYYHYDLLELNPKIEPTSVKHPACVNCANYHGRMYGNNFLVCAIHPYGWDEAKCPDWEQNNKKSDS